MKAVILLLPICALRASLAQSSGWPLGRMGMHGTNPLVPSGLHQDPWAKFLLSSTNVYAISTYPADNGSAIIPLYTDYDAGGTYGFPNYINFAVDPDYPDQCHGTSSYAISWPDTGQYHMQFYIGCSDPNPNRPRDAVNFGLARHVRFCAKPDTTGRQLEIQVWKRDPSCGFAMANNVMVPLVTGWNDYDVDISSLDLQPQQLHAVQFLVGGQSSGTILLDDVRIDTDAYDPLRGIQSYIAHWADKGSMQGTAYRDANIYPNRSYLYDNALAIKGLLAGGYIATATDLANAWMATAPDCTKGFPREPNSGHTLQFDGTARPPWSQLQRLGDDDWFGLALLQLYYETSNMQYATCARQISDWAENNLRAAGQFEGYYGGYDSNGVKLPSRSTEENSAHFQLNSELATLFGQTYADRATWAGTFVIAMFDKGVGRFWAGTSSLDNINMQSVPLDAQTQPFLTLGLSAQYRNAMGVNYVGAITWAESALIVTDMNNHLMGFTYSTQSAMQQNPRVWLEGVAQACLIYEILGQLEPESLTPWGAKAAACIQTLQNASPNGTGVIAASSDDLEDTVLNQFFDARQAVAPTAWAVFVRSLQGIR